MINKSQIAIECSYKMQNATEGVTNCQSNMDLNLIPLQIVLGIIILFIAWRIWLLYKTNVKPVVNSSEDGEDINDG